MASLTDIFKWFQKGDTPTEEQFRETFSSFRHNDNKIPFSDVNDLEKELGKKLDSRHATDENAHNNTLASIDASNLSPQDVISWKEAIGINEEQLLSDVVTKSTDQQIQGTKTFQSPILIQNYKYSGDIAKDRFIISTREFDPRFDRIQIIGNSVFNNLQYVHPDWTRRYVAMGNNLMMDYKGNTDYRPSHPAHDSITAFGSNQGLGVWDGTNISLFGMTNMWLNDIRYWDSIAVFGKGNTNAKQKYSDPNRVAIAESNGYNMREIMGAVNVFGNENWFGDIAESSLFSTSTRLYKSIYRSAVFGHDNMARNPNGDTVNEDAFLDNDVIIGNLLWKDMARLPKTHNLLIGSQVNFDPSYRPLVEGNFLQKYFDIYGKLRVNSGQVLVPDGNDGSTVIFSNLSKDLRLRQRTFIAGRNVFNDLLFENPGSTFGGFVGAGVNNFAVLGTDYTDLDHIDSITVFGQRNGQYHKKGVNIWTFGTAGHTLYSNPMKNIVNVGVLGLGTDLTGKVIPVTPTSNKTLEYNELCVHLGNNYMNHVYNSVITGYGNNNANIVTDSLIIGNNNSFSTEQGIRFTKLIDSSIIMGHGVYTESTYDDNERTHNWTVGINGTLFLKGHYGRGFKRTELFGTVILNDRLRLKPMSKTQRNGMAYVSQGDMIFQNDPGNSGIRVFDGTNWLAVQTTID